MNRRDFFKKTTIAGIAAYSGRSFGDKFNILAQSKTINGNSYDLVAIKGGEPDSMFDTAIQSLGSSFFLLNFLIFRHLRTLEAKNTNPF